MRFVVVTVTGCVFCKVRTVYETGTGYTYLTTYETITGKSKSRLLRKKYEKYDEAQTERSRIP